MATGWFYARNGARYGPFASAQLLALAKSGQLLATDLVWKEGLSDWRPASSIKGLFLDVPEAVSPGRNHAVAVDQGGAAIIPGRARFAARVVFLWGFRLAILISLIAVFLPWVELSSRATTPWESHSTSITVRGFFICWSWLILLVALVAGTLSFLAPNRTVLATLGGLIGVLGVLSIATIRVLSDFFARSFSESQGGVNVSAATEASLAWGVYVMVLAGALAAVCGLLYTSAPRRRSEP